MGDPVAPCPGETVVTSEQVPGNLEVTVSDAKTGEPVENAVVSIAGPEPQAGTTDSAGKIAWQGIQTGGYAVSASRSDHTTGAAQATVTEGETTEAEIKLTPITVAITLAQPVACPGHPLEITATGSPSGGVYAWTIEGEGVDLIDSSGDSTRTGGKVRLRGFQTDASTGNILAQTASITVTYTYSNGSKATAAQTVQIHGIEFVVTNKTIKATRTEVLEVYEDVTLKGPETAGTISTDPMVEMRMDSSCPRKPACAFNHRVGWLQTIISNHREGRYTHSSVNITVPVPIRDRDYGDFPFYATVNNFVNDKDKKTVHHEDSPYVCFAWTDPRKEAPAPPPQENRKLRKISLANDFTAWLVVQNIEYASHDLAGSFAFLGHFDWSVSMDVTVDISKPRGTSISPKQCPPTAPNEIQAGRGDSDPNLATPTAKDRLKIEVSESPPYD